MLTLFAYVIPRMVRGGSAPVEFVGIDQKLIEAWPDKQPFVIVAKN